MKKIIGLLLSIMMLALLVIGCGQSESTNDTAEAPETGTEKLKVALLIPGPINDQGWNATAHAGLMRIQDELGAEVAFAESVAPSDYEEVFRGYASQGYDVIFGHGFQFGDAAKKVATEFPDVKFVVTSTDISQEPNLSSLNNDNLQQGFLAGAMAALITESKVVGSVGGQEIPPIVNYNKGFELGAKYIDPEVKALTTLTGSFDDVSKAKETANAMIKEGADVLTQDANQAGLGVIEAAKDNNILAIGAVGDQAELAPDNVVTSAINDMTKAFVVAAEMIQEGSFKPQAYVFGIKEGTVSLAPYRNFEDKLTEDQKAKIQQVMDDIASGELDILALQ